jgi:hypothetical protein
LKGEIMDGKLVIGKAKIINNNGNIYEGEIKNSLPDGNGIFKFADGTIKDGIYKEGKFISGKITFPDGKVVNI